jgi:hypothetical protein
MVPNNLNNRILDTLRIDIAVPSSREAADERINISSVISMPVIRT